MDYIFFILKCVCILFFLPSHQCADCGTLRLLNTDHINQGDDVRLEFSNIRSQDPSLVQWWKNRNIIVNIDTNLQRFSIAAQHGRVTLTIRNVRAEDNGGYTADLGSIQCSPPSNVLVTVKEPKVLSVIPKFPDNVTIPELDCERCLVGTVGVYINVECIVFGITQTDLNVQLTLRKHGQEVPNVSIELFPFYRAYYAYMPSEDDTDHTVTCEATSDGQQSKTVSITLLVLRKPSIPTIILPESIKEVPPRFIQLEELEKTNDEEGNTSLRLQCTSDVSNPVSKIRWNITSKFEYESSQGKEKVEQLSGNVRAQILSANLTRHNNREPISCYIENPVFPEIKIFNTYNLNITYKPFISFSPSSPVTSYVDDSISVLCQCDANPPAKIEWTNTSSNNIGKKTENSIEMDMQFHSTGRHNFTCNARNTIGSAVNEIFILVKECGTLRALNTDHINPGDDVRLEFSNIRRHDTSLVRWWKNRTILLDTNLQRFSVVVQQGRVTLTISNVTAEDNGGYTADLGNRLCLPPIEVLVKVKEQKVPSINPQFTDSVNIPEMDCAKCLVGTVGVYNKVECIVFGFSEKNMNMELKLKKNGQDVPNVTMECTPFYRAFYAYMPSEEDKDHSIICEATRDGQHSETASITLVILRKPSRPTIILPGSVKEGEKTHITCKTFNARPEPRLYFMYNATTYNTSNNFSQMKGDKTVDAETILENTFSRYDNSRSLTCCVEFREYHTNTQIMKTHCSTSGIDVLFPPKFLLLEELKRTNDAEGNTRLVFQCTSDVSNPVSRIRWNISSNVNNYETSHEKKEDEELSGRIRTKILSANLSRHNNGETLSCFLENPEFPEIKVMEKYKLNITYKPFISFTSDKSEVRSFDDSVNVLCQVDANPFAKIEWLNTSLKEIGNKTESSLELKIRVNSSGHYNYTCMAENTIGSAVNAIAVFFVKDQRLSTPSAPHFNDVSSSMLIGIICGSVAVLIVVILVVAYVIVSKKRQNTPKCEEYTDLQFQEPNLYMQPLGPVYVTSDGSQSTYGQQTQTYDSVE
ncbi:uncharacterized protein LOC128234347 isoform X2 [Mya arenaria]|uniref:uncharacterized protein LOC128234347 isoform X2 n=1 Tax=Mya arenaria TaxID=6604 RepID=UPI0022E2F6EC|nr:uncharacterized protein LOC128234347 isoform X2 [Mya arenaria]